ncbi:MAG: hypothetical protein JNM46_00130 [Anaerolineales bacterium]|nr:hypothetical protein [Anaerolineales bacterium]
MSENQNDPHRGIPPGTPRWVKAMIILFIVLIIIIVIMHLTGNSFGGHNMSFTTDWL